MSRIDRRRIARELRGGVLLGRIDDVDEMMRNAAALGSRDLVGADVEAAIDRGRIAVDDLAVEPLGERERQRALAGRGRPEDRRPNVTGTRSGPAEADTRTITTIDARVLRVHSAYHAVVRTTT